MCNINLLLLNIVIEYLTVKEDISEESITSEPFIANLSGDKNWMVSVKIEDDPKNICILFK